VIKHGLSVVREFVSKADKLGCVRPFGGVATEVFRKAVNGEECVVACIAATLLNSACFDHISLSRSADPRRL
jgi:exopolyphosphatase/pppGpp-phosphohydrolase